MTATSHDPGAGREALAPLADGVWIAHGAVVHLGLRLTTTMTVLRLEDGALLVHSPVSLTPERRAAVEALGPVAHLYAPNTYHHLSPKACPREPEASRVRPESAPVRRRDAISSRDPRARDQPSRMARPVRRPNA